MWDLLHGRRQTDNAIGRGFTPLPKPTIPQEFAERKKVREIPTKPKTETIAIAIYCSVHVFDMEGRADGGSVKNILIDKKTLNTKKLILVHGSQPSTMHLHQWCDEKQVCDEVYAPELGAKVDVSNDVQVYKIKLGDDLLNRVGFQPAGDYSIAFVEGEVLYPGGVDNMDLDMDEEVSPEEYHRRKRGINLSLPDRELPSLADLSNSENPQAGHPTVLIGDPTLSKFARVLVGEGWKTEFKEGCLICDEKVVLRMKKEGDISIEGMLCPEYFQVRDLLYQQYRVL
jgi:cleavage and polyadenylation specificity factor subunit 2